MAANAFAAWEQPAVVIAVAAVVRVCLEVDAGATTRVFVRRGTGPARPINAVLIAGTGITTVATVGRVP